MLTRFLCVVSVCLLVASSARAETTEEALAKIEKLAAQVKTLEMDMKSVMKSHDEGGETSGHYAMQVVEDAGKPARCLFNAKMKSSQGDGPVREILVVCDGYFQWTEIKKLKAETVSVVKSKPEGTVQQLSGDIREFAKYYDLKLAGEEELDGMKAWVLKGTRKPRGEDDPDKVTLWVSQRDGICRRYVMQQTSGDGETMTYESRMSNVKVNGKLDPALFKYTPPDGVEVTDMTKAPAAGGDDAGK